ncbi:DUF4307 domain-containing protein [Brachybacterium rhamnosum]|uniref:DUF4307 domain-containing protein n=1 Tax=Brachybacterium rhamnosum TaxID=173361 RepID=A0ABW4PXA4_9MICO|nr:DUF4307 domain-containing protein [Brachybacterium sp. SGAir0954]QCR53425.1 DUF4307 domain-containing protein [Brachybacterium sp. SGAir0954]
MSDSPARDTARYGGPLVPRRTARLLLVLGAAVALVVLVLVGLRFADQPVRSELVSYDHVGEHAIRVDFTVTMDPGDAATCTIQAMNDGRAQVGFVEVPIPAQTERRTAHTVTISTQGEAVSAEILDCSPV